MNRGAAKVAKPFRRVNETISRKGNVSWRFSLSRMLIGCQWNARRRMSDMSLPPRLASDITAAMKNSIWVRAASSLAFAASFSMLSAQTNDPGFVPIFNGKSLSGWHPSAQTGHSGASKNQSGGKWVVENGAITGSQDIPGNGGILITDEKFGDFEIALEMNNDFGPDSGLFLRSTEEGTAYQAMIDYHRGGNLMGVYGEGKLGGKPAVMNFSFTDDVTRIVPHTNAPTLLPVLPESWTFLWRHGQWNELRARIVNNPPTITTWINGVKFMEWTETQKRHPDAGGIALQVHGGGDFTKQFVRYRNVRVKKLAAN